MKKLITAFVCALTMCALSVCAFADGRLYDGAGLLSDDEAAQVSALLDEVSDAHGANVVIVTTDEALGDPEADARATYEGSFDGDGVIFLLSMNGREWAIWATDGYARHALHERAKRCSPTLRATSAATTLPQVLRALRRAATKCSPSRTTAPPTKSP